MEINKKEKCSISQKNRVVIHLGDAEKRIYKDELLKYQTAGWEIGISEKHRLELSDAKKGKDPWNKNKKGSLKANRTSFKPGNIPWNKNTKGVCTSWNAGQTKETNISIAKGAKSQKENWDSNPERKAAQSQRARQLKGRKLSEEERENFLTKSYITKDKNGTFNTSKPEDDYYMQLINSFGKDDVVRNYRDKFRYPFRCDFYIKSLDLFIELNLHWTHGGKPYDPNDEECKLKLAEWEEKAKISNYYKIAIDTWIHRDVIKLQTAKENNLNYKIIYDLDKE